MSAKEPIYPSVEEVLAKRGKERVTLHRDVTTELADICEELGGCEEGVEWGRTHSFAEVETDFPPEWGAWIISKLGAYLSPEVRAPFLKVAITDNPILAALYWSKLPDLTEKEYAQLEARASESRRVVEMKQQGKLVRADRRVR